MMMKTIRDGGITSAQGFVAGVAQAGIKKAGRYDLAVVASQSEATAAAVFTTNKFQAAPILVSKKNIALGKARGFVVNSGCANACMGAVGYKDAETMAADTAALIGCAPEEIVVASTGVIGVPLPMEKVSAGIQQAGQALSVENGPLAAQAIMTTDTFVKEVAIEVELDGKMIILGGMAKGSGMIHPNMATMLGFVTTDAVITSACLSNALRLANDDSFNMITVDGDTSTNDMLLVLANGAAQNKIIDTPNSPDFHSFCQALNELCRELAKLIAKDGEGATKRLEVQVLQAPTKAGARLAARAIAGSNLVKSAMFGEDANWGRIICAVGYSGLDFNPDLVDVYLGSLLVAQDGQGLSFDEGLAADILKEKDLLIKVDLKQGTEEATAWGCDLTYDYVKINGSYRT